MQHLHDHWPGLCAAAALVGLLVLVIRFKVHAFLALMLVSLGLGLVAGLPPAQVVDAFGKGVGDILRDVLLLLALGAMLGRMLETSGAAELIAKRILNVCGAGNTSFAILMAAFIVGIPILFNVAFLVLIPIVYRLQRETKQSLLYFLLPLAFSLGITHSLVPPHPGIVSAVTTIAGPEQSRRVMVETIIFGIALGVPLVLVGWYGLGGMWARRAFVAAPANLAAPTDKDEPPVAKSFTLALAIVLAPLVLSLAGFGADLLQRNEQLPERMTYTLFDAAGLPHYLRGLNHSPLEWLRFLSRPTVALFVPTMLALGAYGIGRGWSHARLAKLTNEALNDVGGMVFLFGAAGGFKEVIQATRVGDYLQQQMAYLPLSPVAVGFCVAAIVRVALGSATASIATASALVASLAQNMPGHETLLVLSVACGVTVATQPADSGFWMLKEYGNLTEADVILRVNACRTSMALTGLAILLLVEWWLHR
jgi:Gnt-I system low-affinity gluconate transporter